jgi:hypothetical protein
MNGPIGAIGCFSLRDFDLKRTICTFFNNVYRRCGHKASHFYYHPDNHFVPRCKIHRGLHHNKTKLPSVWAEITLIELQTKQRMEIIEYVMIED